MALSFGALPSQISKPPRKEWCASLRLYTATLPTGMMVLRLTESHACSSYLVQQKVLVSPSIARDALYGGDQVVLKVAPARGSGGSNEGCSGGGGGCGDGCGDGYGTWSELSSEVMWP